MPREITTGYYWWRPTKREWLVVRVLGTVALIAGSKTQHTVSYLSDRGEWGARIEPKAEPQKAVA